jgi:NitT/TauT family transport system substrate-binding protein
MSPSRVSSRGPRPLHSLLLVLSLLVVSCASSSAQPASPAPLSCQPAPRPAATPATSSAATPTVPAPAPAMLTAIKVGFVPVSIYAPIFVAKDKGYYAAQGLDVSLEPLAGGADLIALTASGQLQAAAAGAGPALWNAIAQGLPLTLVAPGHREGNPVATPLMISKASCDSGAIRGVADLKGKRVAVNARGATEYWLSQALSTGGLTLDDIDLQTLAFPDAVAALASGAIDASMIGEPLATKAERDGIAVRLATDFPVQDVLPTAIFANTDFAANNPAAVQGFVTAYLQACRDLSGSGFTDPANLAIIERYTGVPAALVAGAVPPVYAVDGQIDPAALGKLQSFFRQRGQLAYDKDIDPNTFIDRQFVDAAVATLGPYSGT